MHPVTGRVHCQFKQCDTASGRFASAEPNLQNIPARSEIGQRMRECFRPRPGYKYIVADYSQIEITIIAEISGDTNLQKVVSMGGDVHAQTAAMMFDLPLEKCGKGTPERNQGKTLNFAIIYGLGDLALAESLGYVTDLKTKYDDLKAAGKITKIPTEEKIVKEALDKARKTKDHYFKTFRGVLAWLKMAEQTPFNQGYSETILGRRCWYTLPDIAVIGQDKYRAETAGMKNEGKNCVDTKTEILTANGWRKYNEVAEGTVILTKNIESGCLEWHPIQQVHIYENYMDDMYYINGKSFSAVCNADHRWIVYNKANGKDVFRKTKNLSLYGDHRIHRTGNYVAPDNPNYTDDEIAAVGLVVTDGYYKYFKDKTRPNRVLMHQSKPSTTSKIHEILDRAGLIHKWAVRSDGCTEWRLTNEFSQKMFRDLPEKKLTPEFLLSLGSSQLEILCTHMISGDGTVGIPLTERDNGKCVFTCKNEESADMFLMLLTLTGKSGYKYSRIIQNRVCWAVNVHRRNRAQLSKKQLTIRSGTGETIWCPSVQNESFVARRNGQTYITGNTPIQGTSADMTKLAMVGVANLILDKGYEAPLVLQIHDELVVEVREDQADQLCNEMKEAMLAAGGQLVKSVPVSVDIHVTDRWEHYVIFTAVINDRNFRNQTNCNVGGSHYAGIFS